MAIPDSTAQLDQFAHGRVPREVRQRQLVALAGELFAERGFAGTSMDELARRAGVSKPVVYDVLGSKDEAFRLVLEGVREQLEREVVAAVAAETDPIAQLTAGSVAFFRFAERHGPTLELMINGGFPDEADRFRRRQAELVTELMTTAAAALGSDADAEAIEMAAYALNGAFEALAHWNFKTMTATPEALTAALVALVGPGLRLLAGLPPVQPQEVPPR